MENIKFLKYYNLNIHDRNNQKMFLKLKNNYELVSNLVIQTVNVFSEALIVFNQNWNERKFI